MYAVYHGADGLRSIAEKVHFSTCVIAEGIYYIFLTKITAAQNEVALSYHRVRVLYFLAAIYAAIIVLQSVIVCCSTWITKINTEVPVTIN